MFFVIFDDGAVFSKRAAISGTMPIANEVLSYFIACMIELGCFPSIATRGDSCMQHERQHRMLIYMNFMGKFYSLYFIMFFVSIAFFMSYILIYIVQILIA